MKNLLMKKLSETLQRKREELDITQTEMAEKCFLSVRQYSDLEKGLRLPSFESFVNIVIQCGIDATNLINDIVKSGYKGNDDRNAL